MSYPRSRLVRRASRDCQVSRWPSSRSSPYQRFEAGNPNIQEDLRRSLYAYMSYPAIVARPRREWRFARVALGSGAEVEGKLWRARRRSRDMRRRRDSRDARQATAVVVAPIDLEAELQAMILK